MRIGIDLMGSDSSPEFLFEAIEKISREVPEATLIVFVTQYALDSIYSLPKTYHQLKIGYCSRIEFQIVSEVIEMNDDPIESFRLKKNSSIVLGLKLLKKNFLDAFVSSGNTGALITGATLSLPLLHEIKRPALLASFPTENGNLTLLDVGGNVSCKSVNLIQFAQMGVAYQRSQEGIQRPRFGL
ncbi:MAG: hypothetical protein Q8K60_04600, partial [Parachlamydiaceae bacterium]|nr:hypothetical protein [Parachlamydiaceae bacterium]